MKKFILLFTCLLLLSGCAPKAAEPETVEATEMVAETEATAAATEAVTVPTETEPQEERFLLTFVGDCTLGSNPINYYAPYGFIKTVGEDWQYPFRNIGGYFLEDECSFANLEGALSDSGNPMQKKHTFRGPEALVNILTENAVEAVTLANNHTLDYGNTAYDTTKETLDEAGIPYAERDGSVVFTTKNGLTIGLYGMVYYKLDVEDMTAEIAALREGGCDLVIVAPHWGAEGSYHPTQEQVDVGHAAIDAGADIVWGSHPHVLQPIEAYNGGMIYYSLGNFVFGGNLYPKDLDSALLQQEIIRDETGVHLGELRIVPVSVSSIEKRNNFQPTPWEPGTEEYDRVLSKLDGSFTGPNLTIG